MPAGLAWLARWMADRHGLHVDLSVEENLPPLAEDMRVLLFESVRELLFNAVKHAHVASANVSMRRVSPGDVRITVSDNGEGFDPGDVKPTGETGRGFGLFSIRERLELLGGQMDIDTAPGQGTRIALTAPIGKVTPPAPLVATVAPPPATVEPAPAPATAAAGGVIRLLIADDHAVVREGLTRLLGDDAGIEVAGEAADGQQAVTLAGTLCPDVILMDVSMPRISGVEATRLIHRDHPGDR